MAKIIDTIKAMKGELILVAVAGLLAFGVIHLQSQPAEAHQYPDNPDFGVWTNNAIMHVLNHISDTYQQVLEEEKKQTALLDQINCNLRHNVSPYRDSTASQTKHCGKLLNYTGVWKK